MTARAKRFAQSFFYQVTTVLELNDEKWKKKQTKYLRIGSRSELGAKKKAKIVYWIFIHNGCVLDSDLLTWNRYRENWKIVNFMWELFAGISFVLNGIFSYHKSHKVLQIPKIRSHCLVICHINFHNVLSFFSPILPSPCLFFPPAFLSTYQRIAFSWKSWVGSWAEYINAVRQFTAKPNSKSKHKRIMFFFFASTLRCDGIVERAKLCTIELWVQKKNKKRRKEIWVLLNQILLNINVFTSRTRQYFFHSFFVAIWLALENAMWK